MKHTQACEETVKRYQREREAYEETWPNHCSACGGWGGKISFYDPSPAGVALAPGTMQDFDTCPSCIENGKCSRCGQQTFTSDEVTSCTGCGFDLNKPDGTPEAPECYCWEDEQLSKNNSIDDPKYDNF